MLYCSDIEIKLKQKIIPGHKFVLASRGGIWATDHLESLNVLDLENLESEVSIYILLEFIALII